MVDQFLKALFFKHAFGNDVAQQVLQTLQEDEYQIPFSKFQNIGSDGPIVNKTIWNYLNEVKIRMGITELMFTMHSKKVCLHMDIKLSNNKVEFGENTRTTLKTLKSDKQKLSELAMKKFYQTVVAYLQRKLPISSELLQNVNCLHPLFQKEEKGVSCIRIIAQKMPHVISSGEKHMQQMNERHIYGN